MTIRNLSCSAPSGTIFEVIGDGNPNPNYRINLDTLIVLDCVNIGNCTNAGAIVVDVCQFSSFSGSYGIRFSGTGGVIYSFVRCGFLNAPASSTVLDFDTVTSSEIELENVICTGDTTATAISGLSSSGNILSGGIASVVGCNFTSFTNPLNNITINDIRWSFRDNLGLSDSQFAADTFLNASTLVTINTINIFELINGGNWSADINSRFSSNTDGTITFNGERPINIKVSGSVTVEKVGGGTDQLEIRIAINSLTQVKTGVVTENATPTSVPLEGLFFIQPGDQIDLWVSNNTSTANVIVSKANLTVVKAG